MYLTFLAILGLLGGSPLVPPQLSAPRATLPVIEPWLLDRNGEPAHWLGQRYQNKVLYEPINIAIIDRFSKTEDQSVEKLMKACAGAGYLVSPGHSCGYRGDINGNSYAQLPRQKNTALSNGDSFSTNNHGRILGPAFYQGGFVFTGGFSRESFNLFGGVFHQFVSFNQARNDFARKLIEGGGYRFSRAMELGNSFQTENETTADHDGKVLVLEAVE